MTDRYRNGWWLERKYHDKWLTQREIGDERNVSPRTIRKYTKKFDSQTRELVGEDHPLYGCERREETKAAISATLKAGELGEEWRAKISEGLTGRRLPQEVRDRIANSSSGRPKSPETRRKMSESTSGEANPNWQGGYSRYYGPGWSIARKLVYNRDSVCQACGHDGSTNRLEVHHIIPVRLFREADDASVIEAHHPSNLILLCNSCHTKADFGGIEFQSGLESPDQTALFGSDTTRTTDFISHC